MDGNLVCTGIIVSGIALALGLDVFLGIVAYRTLRGRN